jgi:hypothetical protein
MPIIVPMYGPTLQYAARRITASHPEATIDMPRQVSTLNNLE